MRHGMITRLTAVLLTGIFFCTFLPGRALPASTNAINNCPPRSQLQAKEKEMVTALTALELQLAEARREQHALAARLAAIRAAAARTSATLQREQQQLAIEQQHLGQFLSFIYRRGTAGFWAMLLEAGNFNDFLEHTFLLTILLSRQMNLIRQTGHQAGAVKAGLAQYRQLQSLLEEENTRLNDTIDRTQNLQAKQTVLLTEVRREMGQAAAQILEKARQWLQVVDTLNHVLQQLGTLPAGQLLPDHLSFASGHLQAELSADTINRTLASAAGNTVRQLSVSIRSGGLTISGVTSPGEMAFSLAGNFTVPPAGKEIFFQPAGLSINDQPVDKTLLSYISQQQPLGWNAGSRFPFLSINSITPVRDKLIITFNN